MPAAVCRCDRLSRLAQGSAPHRSAIGRASVAGAARRPRSARRRGQPRARAARLRGVAGAAGAPSVAAKEARNAVLPAFHGATEPGAALVVTPAVPPIRAAGAAPLAILLRPRVAGAAGAAPGLSPTLTAPRANAGAGIGADLLRPALTARQQPPSRRHDSGRGPAQHRAPGGCRGKRPRQIIEPLVVHIASNVDLHATLARAAAADPSSRLSIVTSSAQTMRRVGAKVNPV